MDEALKKFKKVIEKYPNISAHGYDNLKEIRPDRRTLERKHNRRWSELLELIGFIRDYPGSIANKRKVVNEENIKEDYSADSGFVEVNSFTIHTLDQAIETAKVDLNKWEIERYVVNSWQVTMKVRTRAGEVEVDEPVTRTNYQVKIWLKAKVVSLEKESIKLLIKEIPKLKVPKRRLIKPKGDYALEITPYDIHYGKLAWGKETMQGSFDLKTAGKWFLSAIEDNLNMAEPFPISKIYYILGQDYMHVENYMGITPLAGHGLDVDGRLIKVYLEAKMSVLKAIYMCKDIAPVEILWVPGNHDMHASYYLSEVVKEHFSKDPFVEVDNSPSWKKARLWGNLLVGYTHDASGGKAKVTVNMLPQFWPELWGKSKFREWHTGHKHKKNEEKFAPTTTLGGVIIRQIPTLSVIDAWHTQHGFVDAVPAGESFIWTKDAGICAHHTANVKIDKDK